jgi:hypothetical protein
MIPQIDDQMYLYQFIQRRFVPRKGESHATIATSEMANPKFVSSQVKQLVDDVQVFCFVYLGFLGVFWLPGFISMSFG